MTTVCQSSLVSEQGGNVPVVLESNQNHARAEDTEVCTCLPAAMGNGGGYVPMIVMLRRSSDIRVRDTEITPTIEGGGGEGGNNLPMILYDLSEHNRMSKPRSASGELQRAGCVQRYVGD